MDDIIVQAAVFVGIAVFASVSNYRRENRRKSKKKLICDGIRDGIRPNWNFVKFTVSCPGKVLLVGGYLVLERPNVGLILATSARFYTTIRLQHMSNDEKLLHYHVKPILVVHSPQFHQSYYYSILDVGRIMRIHGSPQNTFVEACLSLSLTFVWSQRGQDFFDNFLNVLRDEDRVLEITLQADNDFYSHILELERRQLPISYEGLRMLPPRLVSTINDETKSSVTKTGLGSSAALTTSIIAAILQFFGLCDLGSSSIGSEVVFRLSQLSHSLAQGKVGSGFDVSAAVYGSQKYTRFSSQLFQSVLDSVSDSSSILVDAKTLNNVIITNDRAWDQVIDPISLPKGMELLMGDVCGGSSTPSMVKNILHWRKTEQVTAVPLWDRQSVLNQDVADAFQSLCLFTKGLKDELLQVCLAALSHARISNWDSVTQNFASDKREAIVALAGHLTRLNACFSLARHGLNGIGRAAHVDIEPPHQTDLINATSFLDGVIMSGVPGAGGSDAVFALVLHADASNRVRQLWQEWGIDSSDDRDMRKRLVCCLTLTSCNDGIRLEN